MKVYAVKVAKVTACEGYPCGDEVLAYTVNAEKAEEVRAAEAERILNKPYWWMTHAKRDGRPVIKVEELGEVVE